MLSAEFSDIGGGHQARLIYDEHGTPVMLEDWHNAVDPRAGDPQGLCSVTIDITTEDTPETRGYQNKEVWYFDVINQTLHPSLICAECRMHGHIVNGLWNGISRFQQFRETSELPLPIRINNLFKGLL